MGVKIEKDNSISISGFEGIGQSPMSDFSDILGINITDNPGVASINFKFNKVLQTQSKVTVTFHGSDYVAMSSGNATYRGTYLGRAVRFTTTGTLPTGLTAGTVYYISANGSPTNSTFRIDNVLKSALAGTAYVSFTGGSGTHTMEFISPEEITGYTKNGSGKIFALDSNQRVWFNSSDGVNEPWYLIAGNTGQGSSGQGNGIIYYKGYILVWTAGHVDALTDLNSPSTTITWELAFETVTISNSMANGGKGAVPFLSVNDNAIYFANGAVNDDYQIGLLEENDGQTFNPTNTATFDFVADATIIPFSSSNGFATSIKEINQYLIIGTYADKVYFWDKKSPAFTTYIELPESGVASIETVGNVAYIFMANSGSIYAGDTTGSQPILNLPDYLTNEYYGFISGLDTFKTNYTTVYNRELLFSITIATSNKSYNYLMSYNLDTKKLTKKNISSYGESGDRNGTNYGKITGIIPFGRNIFIGSSYYTDSTSSYQYAIESLHYVASTESGTSTYFVYDNYEPNIITGLISYGDVYNKKTLRELSISLLRPLETGQGIKISYRYDDNSSWTELKTIDYATNGAIKQIKTPALITNIIDLQVKIELKGTGQTSPRLKLVRFIP